MNGFMYPSGDSKMKTNGVVYGLFDNNNTTVNLSLITSNYKKLVLGENLFILPVKFYFYDTEWVYATPSISYDATTGVLTVHTGNSWLRMTYKVYYA